MLEDSSEYSTREVDELVREALFSKLWYKLHLILTNRSFADKLVWKNDNINGSHPLVITNYILNIFLALHKRAENRKDRNAVKQLRFAELQYPYEYYNGGEELLVWLLCTYESSG